MSVTSVWLAVLAIALLLALRMLSRKRKLPSRPYSPGQYQPPPMPSEPRLPGDGSGTASTAQTPGVDTITPDADTAVYQQRFQEAARLIAHGDFDHGFTIATDVLEFARSNGYPALSGAALSLLADVYRHRGDLEAAENATVESLRDTRQADPHPWALAISVASAGENAYRRGHLDDAARRYREALELIGTALEHPLYIVVVERLAECEFRHNNLPQAKRLQQRALEFHEAKGNTAQVIGALRNLALCDRTMGHFEDACQTFRRCHDEALAASDLLTAHIALGEEGITWAAAKQHERAETVLRQSLALQEEHQLIAGGTIARLALCQSLLALARPIEALAEMETAISYPTHQRSDQDDFFRAECYSKAGKEQNAIEIFERLLDRSRHEGNPHLEAACLGNLGHLHRVVGTFEVARQHFEAALTLHRRHGDVDGEAEDVRQLRALEENAGGRRGEDLEEFNDWAALLISPNAEERLRAMLRDARAKGELFLEFNALDGLGVVARNRGALEEAIGLHEQALKLGAAMDGIHAVVPTVVGNNNLGIAFRMVGDFDRARLCYQSAITAARTSLGVNNPLELMPRVNLAKLRLLEGNPDAARREYLEEPRMITSKTDELMDLDIRINIFEALRDTASLLPALKQMAEKCAAAGLREREADAYKQLGYNHHARGEESVALDFYDRAMTLLGDFGANRRERAEVLYHRSLVRIAQNDYLAAFDDAARSLKESSVLTNELSLDSVKRYARTQHVERYANLAVICGQLDRIPEAIEYLERARSGLLNSLLATQHIAPGSEVPPDLVRDLRELQTQRRRLDLLIVQEQEMPLYKGRMGELVTQQLALTSKLKDVVTQVAVYDPFFEQFRDEPIRYEQVEALIPTDTRTALLEFCVSDTSTLIVLVIPGMLKRAYRNATLSRYRLHDLLNRNWFGPLNRLRAPLKGDRTRLRANELDLMNDVLGELHDELFGLKSADGETLTDCLERYQVTRLLVIPHGLLHLVPLHAMWRKSNQERQYLIDQFEVVYAPSCGVLRYCVRNSAGCESLLIFADPDGSLRGARNEAASIKTFFTEATVYTGSEVTVDSVLRLSMSSDVIHFACHGSFDVESPLSSALAMADGKLTLNRVFEECRVTPGALVTLSACETGMVAPDRTDEYIGLPSGFLFAGANCVIGSLWPVDDASTSSIMAETYERIRRDNKSPAASLRAAQKALRKSSAYAHPYFWAPFQAMGAGWSPRSHP